MLSNTVPCIIIYITFNKFWVQILLLYHQVVTTIMGNGDQRSMDCVSPECSNGPADKQKLLGPKSIAASPDGALYVADYNIIRKISPDSTVKTILKLK